MPDARPPSSPGFDAYKTLQVDPEADPEVIQAAYRRLAQKFHPDVAGTASSERMASINMAWEILRDQERRAAYDRSRMPASSGDLPGASSGWSAGSGWGPDAPRARGSASTGRADHASGDARGGSSPSGDRSSSGGGSSSGGAAPSGGTSGRGEAVSPDWTSGRSTTGSGYDPSTMRRPDGEGAAGPPPGNPSGSVLTFGRYTGWSLGEIARVDAEYLEWLDRAPIGRTYRDELDPILRRLGRRRSARSPQEESRSGLFRRR